jgi:hypothetical protein
MPRNLDEKCCSRIPSFEKCVFAITELDFLDHRISAAGVAPLLRDNVQVILDFPTPH